MNVMSYSLYWSPFSRYEDPRAGAWTGFRFYPSFLPTLVRAHHIVFPDYELRIHHDGCVETCYYGRALVELSNRGLVKLRYVGKAATLCGPMLWRLLPVWDQEVEHVFCRDVDALPMPRERIAVDEFTDPWMFLLAHALYDHPQHGHGLCGGMIGFDAPKLRALTGLRSLGALLALSPEIDLDVPGADQDLLNAHLLPMVEHELLRDGEIPVRGGKVGLDALAPCIGLGYARAPVVEFCRGKGRTDEIEAVEELTGTPPLIEQAAP